MIDTIELNKDNNRASNETIQECRNEVEYSRRVVNFKKALEATNSIWHLLSEGVLEDELVFAYQGFTEKAKKETIVQLIVAKSGDNFTVRYTTTEKAMIFTKCSKDFLECYFAEVLEKTDSGKSILDDYMLAIKEYLK